MNGYGVIEKLNPEHDLSDFDGGLDEFNHFLWCHALQNQKANSAQTYVASRAGVVLGYYSLTVGSVGPAQEPEGVKQDPPRYPIPVLVLTRLVVHKHWRGRGLGAGLLKDALIRTARAADLLGVRALVVQAKDDHARTYYERYNFESSLTDPYHLFLLVKDIARRLREAGP